MRLEYTPDSLHVSVRWTDLPAEENALEPITRVYEDVAQLLQRFFTRKSSPLHLKHKARRKLGGLKGGVQLPG